MSFNYPELYNNYSSLQKRDAQVVIENFAECLDKKNKGLRLIDIGTGDGGVLTKIVCKQFDLKFVLGIDKAAKMIEFSRKHHENETLKFETIDIGEDIEHNLALKYAEKFDIVTSFYCLHWVQDLR